MSDWLDTLFRAGSLGGLVSASILLYDRLNGTRPSVQFVIEEPFVGGSRFSKLEVIAGSSGDIWITGVRVFPKGIDVQKDYSVTATVRVVMGKSFEAIVRRDEIVAFPISTRSNSRWPCILLIRWRSLNSPSRWQIPIVRWVAPRTIRRLQQDLDDSVDQ